MTRLLYPDGTQEVFDGLPNAVTVPGGTCATVYGDDARVHYQRLVGWTTWEEIGRTPCGRLAAVNAALAALGESPRLVKGRGGYYYFNGPALGWPGGSSVAVAQASQLTVDQWLAEYRQMKP